MPHPWIEQSIDFEGQKAVDSLVHNYLYFAGFLSLVFGYYTGSVVYILYPAAILVVFLLIFVLPAWPIYKKNPVTWAKIEF